jgi:hypothetical protein
LDSSATDFGFYDTPAGSEIFKVRGNGTVVVGEETINGNNAEPTEVLSVKLKGCPACATGSGPMIAFWHRWGGGPENAYNAWRQGAIGTAYTSGNHGASMLFYTNPDDGEAYEAGTLYNLVERMRITHEGRVGVGKSTPATIVDVAGTTTTEKLVVTTPTVPSAATDACTAGTISWDASYIYVCTASGAWKRASLGTW